MEATLWQSILNYGALGVLTILFFLFSKGYIVSKVTLDQAIASHKATIERIVEEDSEQRKETKEESARQRLISDKKDMSNIVLESEETLVQGLILRIVDGHE